MNRFFFFSIISTILCLNMFSGYNLYEYFHRKSLENIDFLKQKYASLDKDIKTGKLSSGVCHEESHKIGEDYLKRVPNFEEAFSVDVYNYISDSNCATGYYHGLMIGLAKTHTQHELMQKISQIVQTYEPLIYSTIRGSSQNLTYIDMVHGIGHAFYSVENDIGKSNKRCEAISKNKEIQSVCKSGVYMEDSFQRRFVGIESKPEDCMQEKFDDMYACLVGQRSSENYLLSNYKKIFPFCHREENTLFKYACYRNLFLELALFPSGLSNEYLKTLCPDGVCRAVSDIKRSNKDPIFLFPSSPEFQND